MTALKQKTLFSKKSKDRKLSGEQTNKLFGPKLEQNTLYQKFFKIFTIVIFVSLYCPVIQGQQTYLLIVTHFIIAYHISLVKVQTNYCNNNLLILDVKQLNKIMKLYYFYTLKALWDDQGKSKMYYGMSKVKKQLSRKRSILEHLRGRVQFF